MSTQDGSSPQEGRQRTTLTASSRDCCIPIWLADSQRNGASQALLGRIDGPGVHVTPGGEPLDRGAHAERSGGFVAHAQSCGGACHAIERTLWSNEHAAVPSAENLTEGRQFRRDRDGRSGYSLGRDDTGDIQNRVAVKGGDVDCRAELPGE